MIYESTGGIKDRKRAVLQKFKGVDTSVPLYAVDPSRASAMRNFINSNGANHKRPGWRQFARFKNSSGNDQRINGYFKFVISQQTYTIVYAGKTFYAYDETMGEFYDLVKGRGTIGSTNYIPSMASYGFENQVDESLLLDQKTQVFIRDDRAYFIGCGDYLVFALYDGVPQLRRVYKDENTYIPRTTTNIGPNEEEVDENENPIAYASRQTDRDVNLFTPVRYNELIGSAQADPDEVNNGANPTFRTYTLDTQEIDSESLTVDFYDYDEETGVSTDHTLVVGESTTEWLGSSVTEDRAPVVGDNLRNKTIAFNTAKTTFKESVYTFSSERDVISAGKFKLVARRADNGSWNHFNLYAIYDGTETRICYIERSTIFSTYYITWYNATYTVPNDEDCVVTYASMLKAFYATAPLPAAVRKLIEEDSGGEGIDLTWGYADLRGGTLAFIRPMRPISGEPNIKVTFSRTDLDAVRAIINCTFGAYFGVHGNANTLFLSGNAGAKSFDYWSAAEDFTYFPSGNYCQVGTQNTAVKGYIRLGDDSLAIIKEPSQTEPTLYIRTGEETATYKDSEDRTHVTDGYYKTVGKFITEGCVADGSCAMFAGDAVFLSQKGLYGIAIGTDSIAVEQRVARERSRFINELFRKHKDLSKAVSIVFDNRLYIALDGAVYVADARFKSNERGDMADTFNYEWWVWDHCPVRAWYEIDGELCFGTDDGRLCVFDKEYTDRTYETRSVTYDVANNRIYPAAGHTLTDGSLVQFKGDIYRLLLDSSDMTLANGKIKVSEENIAKIVVGQAVYADTVTGSALSLHTKYYVSDVDYGECTFNLETAEGAVVSQISLGFRLLCNFDGEICKIDTGLDENEDLFFTPKNYYSGENYTITTYNGEVNTAECREYFQKNVVAEWYTPVMDMGANDYVKQLLSLTIATEQVTNGRLTFGWETRGADSLVDVDSKGLDVFDFGNLDFDRFAFDTGFSTSFSRKVKANFNFVIFRFVSDNEYDCCVHNFTIGYKVNRKNKGVF